MTTTPEFEQNLRRIEERSAAFRAALTALTPLTAGGSLDAPLAAKVPSCPEWTLGDLVVHLGMVHRFWAAMVTAGPADTPLPEEDFLAPEGLGAEALPAWSQASTEELLSALRAAGPDRGCWTWWGASDAAQTAGPVAPHQVAEALVHTYDAQLAVGRPVSLPTEEALDAIDEFLRVGCGAAGPWPNPAAVVVLRAAEGRGWLLELTSEGSRARSLPGAAVTDTTPAHPVATVTAHGTASELVLALYGRMPMESLDIEGDREVLTLLRAWQPSE
ncbi:maleylpyruvate isomerase family mycothiol-dependent enzyme [Streptacidiphilus anmyonensis]|uniref:maleylpyruvate isomerase family mycothiol-dependent enzyme n=1 Tax=Streptacidiphilus anmyonensis TaxID=405782 RepID=UPI0005A90970|nr:maleylpyruvate isomerase family mycothiol-dependent enzyme [Streptacidiphilus anmyonensis]